MEKYEFIKYWFEKAKDEKDVSTKLIFLWISFNAFYSKQVESGKSLEREIDLMYSKMKENHSENLFKLIIKKSDAFKDFKKYIDYKDKNKGYISDLRYINPEDIKDYKKSKYTEIDSVKDYLKCVYQIRCNLIYGDKIPNDGNDKELIMLATNSLNIFLTSIYKNENIIS